MTGRFITFEGIDGSGKSTQIQLLEREFKRIGLPFKTYREPGGTQLSEKIRAILLDRENIALTAGSESMLFAAARASIDWPSGPYRQDHAMYRPRPCRPR